MRQFSPDIRESHSGSAVKLLHHRREFLSKKHDSGNDWPRNIIKIIEVLLRDDEGVPRSDWSFIEKSYLNLVLINDVRSDVVRCNLTKAALSCHCSPGP